MQEQNIPSLEGEIWKDIPGYEGHYMVSNIGRIYSFRRDMIMKLYIIRRYMRVGLFMNGKLKHVSVSRIVASAFLGLDLYQKVDMKNMICVCHKDDNPLNNNVDNLFLGNMKDNIIDREIKGRNAAKGKFGILSKSSIKILQYDLSGAYIRSYWGGNEASRITGFSKSSIWRVVNGEAESFKGFIFTI